MSRKKYQGCYDNKMDAELSHEARYTWKTAPLVVGIHPEVLHELFTTGKRIETYRLLADLNLHQLTRQAYAYAAYYNDVNNLCQSAERFEGDEVLSKWNERMSQLEAQLQESNEDAPTQTA